MILGIVGLYGVVKNVVTQRTHEIGIRIALGAGPREILRLILIRFSVLTLIGIAGGITFALLLGRVTGE